jgi:hypothetical protein
MWKENWGFIESKSKTKIWLKVKVKQHNIWFYDESSFIELWMDEWLKITP